MNIIFVNYLPIEINAIIQQYLVCKKCKKNVFCLACYHYRLCLNDIKHKRHRRVMQIYTLQPSTNLVVRIKHILYTLFCDQIRSNNRPIVLKTDSLCIQQTRCHTEKYYFRYGTLYLICFGIYCIIINVVMFYNIHSIKNYFVSSTNLPII